METSYTAFSRATLLLLNTYYRAIRYTSSPGKSSGLKRMRIFIGLFMQGGVARRKGAWTGLSRFVDDLRDWTIHPHPKDLKGCFVVM